MVQADILGEHSWRIRALQQAAQLLEGQQLDAVAQVMRNALREQLRASVGAAATDAAVAQAMAQSQGLRVSQAGEQDPAATLPCWQQ